MGASKGKPQRARLPFRHVRITGNTIAVPADIRRHIKEDQVFKCEPNEEGILYRFVQVEPDPPEPVPNWMAEK